MVRFQKEKHKNNENSLVEFFFFLYTKGLFLKYSELDHLFTAQNNVPC